MPCEECENGKVKWGKTGSCKYETKADCESDNKDYYKKNTMRPTPLGKKSYEEYEKELKEFNLSKVEKVNLSLADDIKKQAQKIESAISKFGSDKGVQLFKDLSKKVKDLADKTRDEVDSNETKIYREVNVLTPLMEKFIAASKELGVEEILKQPVFKNANDLIKQADDEKELSIKLVNRIRADYL
tara:strand:- start:329 stop:886 length:558 start_codon:yes stop_codon:yes gene_type:complete